MCTSSKKKAAPATKVAPAPAPITPKAAPTIAPKKPVDTQPVDTTTGFAAPTPSAPEKIAGKFSPFSFLSRGVGNNPLSGDGFREKSNYSSRSRIKSRGRSSLRIRRTGVGGLGQRPGVNI